MNSTHNIQSFLNTIVLENRKLLLNENFYSILYCKKIALLTGFHLVYTTILVYPKHIVSSLEK